MNDFNNLLYLSYISLLCIFRLDYPTNTCCPFIETSQLICRANQLTAFCMRATLALNGLNEYESFFLKKDTQHMAEKLVPDPFLKSELSISLDQ